MRAHARARDASASVLAHASAGRHARTSDSAEEEEEEFDFARPFLIDIGRAAVIAEWLRESGYPRCTADVVTAELARPERERSSIGRFAADQLKTAGWRP
jgi:hypothetical protein